MYIRITKYDPTYRDERGVFVGNDWTALSDVSVANGPSVSEYLAIEENYCAVVLSIFESLSLSEATISGIEFYDDDMDDYASCDWYETYLDALKEFRSLNICKKTRVDIPMVKILLRMMLRDVVWMKVDFDDGAYLRVGHDFYVNFGSPRKFDWASVDGMFVEEMSFSYIEDEVSGHLFH